MMHAKSHEHDEDNSEETGFVEIEGVLLKLSQPYDAPG